MLTKSQLTALHRRQQLALRKVTLNEMARIWPALSWADLDASYPAFAALVAGLVTRNRRTSAGLAAQYVRAVRVTSGLTGDIKVVIPPMDPEAFRTGLVVTSKVAVKTAAARGVFEDVAMANALSTSSGAMARLVLNGGRETAMATLAEDREVKSWTRILGGTGCQFCRMLAGREYPASTADFECHNRCGCGMSPNY